MFRAVLSKNFHYFINNIYLLFTCIVTNNAIYSYFHVHATSVDFFNIFCYIQYFAIYFGHHIWIFVCIDQLGDQNRCDVLHPTMQCTLLDLSFQICNNSNILSLWVYFLNGLIVNDLSIHIAFSFGIKMSKLDVPNLSLLLFL